MSPALLLTLSGKNNNPLSENDIERLGWIEAVISAAISNVVGDVVAVSNQTEDKKTMILNTLFPYVGKYIGNKLWPVHRQADTPQAKTPKKLSEFPPEVQQKAALVITGIPFAGSLIYQIAKGIK